MKLCFLTYNIFSQGGVQRVVTTLANELCDEYEITIICVNNKNEVDESLYNLNTKKIKVIFKTMDISFIERIFRKTTLVLNRKFGCFNNKYLSKFFLDIIFPVRMRNEYSDWLNSQNYDVIIGVEGFFGLFLGYISESLKAKTIGWQHNSFEAYLKLKSDRYYYKMEEIFKYCIPKLDSHVVLTHYDKKRYKTELDIDSNVIYNPKSFDCNFPSDCSQKTFVSVGRLTKAKGFDLLIEAFNIFSKKNNDWNLIIIGEGEEKADLQYKIKKYKLENRILLVGETNNIEKFYLNSSIYLSASRWEGLPLVLIEAIECGLPIISFDYPAAKEIIKENNGFLIKQYNITEYANKMLLLVQDNELRNKISINNQQYRKNFDKKIILESWNKII